MVVCLTSARFNMKADILRSEVEREDPEGSGQWIITHDPDSNEIIRKWQPYDEGSATPDNPFTTLKSFKCMVRGIVDGGIRVAGTTERFGDLYEGVDYVRMWFPVRTPITRRDRITNIRDKRGTILWREEERSDNAPTVFSVVGVTPIIDPFGAHTENMALLERAEGQ